MASELLRAPDTKPDGLSLISGTLMVKGENQPSKAPKLFSGFLPGVMVHELTHIHTPKTNVITNGEEILNERNYGL